VSTALPDIDSRAGQRPETVVDLNNRGNRRNRLCDTSGGRGLRAKGRATSKRLHAASRGRD
jgi:hypothetical protein